MYGTNPAGQKVTNSRNPYKRPQWVGVYIISIFKIMEYYHNINDNFAMSTRCTPGSAHLAMVNRLFCRWSVGLERRIEALTVPCVYWERMFIRTFSALGDALRQCATEIDIYITLRVDFCSELIQSHSRMRDSATACNEVMSRWRMTRKVICISVRLMQSDD